MNHRSAAIIVPAAFFAALLPSANTAAKPITTTTISTESAEAFCHGHGGGINCVFCHRDHCHVISCSKGYGGETFCTNTVSFRRINRGGFGPPAGFKTTGGIVPPKGHPRPVKIIGFKPPSGIKTTGGNSTPVTIQRSVGQHSGGGHR
jgi:hypothetical protein